MSSFLLQSTIIPFQVTLLGMHHFSHVQPQIIIPIQLNLLGMHDASLLTGLSQSFSKAVLTTAVKVFGHATKSPLIELKLI